MMFCANTVVEMLEAESSLRGCVVRLARHLVLAGRAQKVFIPHTCLILPPVPEAALHVIALIKFTLPQPESHHAPMPNNRSLCVHSFALRPS
jgi:hypothetical protein